MINDATIKNGIYTLYHISNYSIIVFNSFPNYQYDKSSKEKKFNLNEIV
jgi:hypothetical protein